jgi:transposase InsO family protein
MAMKVIAMQVKLAAALARQSQGEKLDVTATCRQLGISRQTFYKYAARFDAEGVEGLLERSRRPAASPGQTCAALEDEIVRWRKQLIDQGWDGGAASIWHRMRRAGGNPPSARTVHRVLVRRGLVTPEPTKRPRSSYRRFEYARTNDCWQIDATECPLVGGTSAVVFHLIDDCSRKSLGSLAATSETAEAANRCVSQAIAASGVPAMFLSDNGAAFSAKCRGGEAELERALRALGVRVVTSSPFHPQTCGKNERLHQTFKPWLARQPQPGGGAELQALAHTFDHLYNSERPHSALHGATPNEAWAARERCPEPSTPQDPSTRISTVAVARNGAVPIGKRRQVQVGRQWAGATVTTIITGDHVRILYKRQLVRDITIDPNRLYQPLGRSHSGRRRLPRLVSTMS